MKDDVGAAFEAFPPQERAGLLALRDQIFAVASENPGVGRVSEELRWGQPAYLTPETKSGSTIRLGVPKTGGFALYVHCRTRLIHDFSAMAGPEWQVEGTRAVLFSDKDQVGDPAIRNLIRNALTYHRQPARSTG